MTCSSTTELVDLFNSPADPVRRAIDSISNRRVTSRPRRCIDGPNKASRPRHRRSTHRGHRDGRLEGLVDADDTSRETTDAVSRVTCIIATDRDVPVRTYSGNRCSCCGEADECDNISTHHVMSFAEDDVDEYGK